MSPAALGDEPSSLSLSTFTTCFLHSIYHHQDFRKCCLSSLDCKPQRARAVSALSPAIPGMPRTCLAHGRCSTNSNWVSEWPDAVQRIWRRQSNLAGLDRFFCSDTGAERLTYLILNQGHNMNLRYLIQGCLDYSWHANFSFPPKICERKVITGLALSSLFFLLHFVSIPGHGNANGFSKCILRILLNWL